MPDERLRAVNKTRDFLRRLLNPKETPGVPKAIRHEAYRCLKHYPGEYHMEQAAKHSEVFSCDLALFNQITNSYITNSEPIPAELRLQAKKRLMNGAKKVK